MRVVLANSFSIAEVRALLELHARVLRGDDARALATQADVLKLVRKFTAMRAKHELAKLPGDKSR